MIHTHKSLYIFNTYNLAVLTNKCPPIIVSKVFFYGSLQNGKRRRLGDVWGLGERNCESDCDRDVK